MTQLPPGPFDHLLFGSLPRMKAAPLAFMTDAADRFGPIARLRMPWPLKALVQVSSPKLAEQVLVTNAQSFSKSRVQRSMVNLLLGDGVFLAEGDAWRRKRRVVQPAFAREKVEGYLPTILHYTDAMIDDWCRRGAVDAHTDCANLTLRVAARTLFGVQLQREVERARKAMEQVNAALDAHINSLIPLPLSVPTPAGLRLRLAALRLDKIVFKLIRQRRRGRGLGDDLLSLLLAARHEDGTPLTRRELRDEAVTAFISGTETTGLSLAWTFHLLATHPDVARRVRAEVLDVLDGASVLQPSHLGRLAFTRGVVLESMRLYPPFWHVAREARCDTELGGYFIPKGTLVLVMAHLLHRDVALFPEPERFVPERWTRELMRSLPSLAYSPFGGGQRKCVGEQFAMTELVATVAQVARRVEVSVRDQPPTPRPVATLRPEGGFEIRVAATVERAPAGAVAIPVG